VLAEYESQAAGLDATFYDLGLQYGIDPAYALAFFIMEGQAGTHGVAHDTQHRKHPLHAGVSLCGGLPGL
jgi:hypothetical protein